MAEPTSPAACVNPPAGGRWSGPFADLLNGDGTELLTESQLKDGITDSQLDGCLDEYEKGFFFTNITPYPKNNIFQSILLNRNSLTNARLAIAIVKPYLDYNSEREVTIILNCWQ